MPDELSSIRLDKWLWAARIYKTRNMASEAVTGGKVHCNGERTKPSKLIKPGDQLQIRKGPYEWNITVYGLSKQRLSAPAAQELYKESEESLSARAQRREQILAENAFRRVPERRPTKRERRQLVNFKTRTGQ